VRNALQVSYLMEQDMMIDGATLKKGLSRSRDVLGDEVMQVIFRYLEGNGFKFSSNVKYSKSKVNLAIRDVLGDYGAGIMMENLTRDVQQQQQFGRKQEKAIPSSSSPSSSPSS
jgi:hypothetical protein